jgi:hypothetical protein
VSFRRGEQECVSFPVWRLEAQRSDLRRTAMGFAYGPLGVFLGACQVEPLLALRVFDETIVAASLTTTF